MSRPTQEERAKARAHVQWFIATMPTHSMAESMRVMLAASAPVTQAEAIPMMIQFANEAGNWTPNDTDLDRAIGGIEGTDRSSFGGSVRAQWATLVHFFAGAE
jgi:hypothetical protein